MTNTELLAKIKAEIDKRYAEYREKMKTDDFTYYEGMADALDLFEQFLDTLESEKTISPWKKIHTYTEEIHEGDMEKMLLELSVGKGEKRTKIALPDRIVDFLESEKPINPADAMKEIEEKIALVKQRGTWDGVDVDKYMDEVRGREPENPVPNDLDFEQELYNHFGQIKDFTLGMRIGQYFYNLGRDSVPLPEDTVLFNKGVAEGRRLESEENKDRDIVFWRGIQYAKEQMLKDGLDAVKTLDFNKAEKTIAGVFVKYGMDRQKEQMMKEAVEIGTTEICWVPDGDRVFPTFDPPVEDLLMPGIISQRFKDGDKVRIIIVREDRI